MQAKSRANKEKNERELFEKTNAMLGYDDYLMAQGKNLVIKPDGKYMALTDSEYAVAFKAGKIKRDQTDILLD